MNQSRSRGTTALEFAIVIATLLVVIFGILDLSRIVYLHMTLEEGVRRAARLAAVCPPGSSLIKKAAVFQDSAAQGAAIPGATLENVNVVYLNEGGLLADPLSQFTSVRFVRVSVDGVSLSLFFPFVTGIFAPTNISSTTSAESLGVLPVTGSSVPLPCN
jgi:Flp pilus assembly protein TadG